MGTADMQLYTQLPVQHLCCIIVTRCSYITTWLCVNGLLKCQSFTYCSYLGHHQYINCFLSLPTSYGSFTYCSYLGHQQYINCSLSPPTSILKGYIKIDYLIKSQVHWKFFVEISSKHYSDSETYLKNSFALYKHTLQQFIGIIDNQYSPPTHHYFCLTWGRETSNILMMVLVYNTAVCQLIATECSAHRETVMVVRKTIMIT